MGSETVEIFSSSVGEWACRRSVSCSPPFWTAAVLDSKFWGKSHRAFVGTGATGVDTTP